MFSRAGSSRGKKVEEIVNTRTAYSSRKSSKSSKSSESSNRPATPLLAGTEHGGEELPDLENDQPVDSYSNCSHSSLTERYRYVTLWPEVGNRTYGCHGCGYKFKELFVGRDGTIYVDVENPLNPNSKHYKKMFEIKNDPTPIRPFYRSKGEIESKRNM